MWKDDKDALRLSCCWCRTLRCSICTWGKEKRKELPGNWQTSAYWWKYLLWKYCKIDRISECILWKKSYILYDQGERFWQKKVMQVIEKSGFCFMAWWSYAHLLSAYCNFSDRVNTAIGFPKVRLFIRAILYGKSLTAAARQFRFRENIKIS